MRSHIFTFFFICTSLLGSPNYGGLFFSIGSGFNTDELHDWIRTSQTGANFGFEFNKERTHFRFAFNPETSGGLQEWWTDPITTNRNVEIDSVEWPSNIRINFEAFQGVLGYEMRAKGLFVIPYAGVAFSRLSVPFEYEPHWDGKSRPQPRLYKSKFVLGPTIHLSVRKKLEILSPHNPNRILFSIDAGVIQPMFSRKLNTSLKGVHPYIKVGLVFDIYLPSNFTRNAL